MEKELREHYYQLLCEENSKLREVGLALAIASINVIKDNDGLHRLALAVSSWMKVIAYENGRECYEKSSEESEF